MEDILAKLLVADNDTIKKGTAELRDAFKKPEHVNSLLQIAMSSKNAEIRQCAVVLLKKRYKVSSNWFQLPQNVRDQFKCAIIQCLMNETDKHVQNSVALMVGVISRHELPNNLWPEILQFIEQSTLSSDAQHNLLGMFTLSAMTDEAAKVFMKHIQAIITLLEHIFANKQNVSAEISFYAIKVMINLTENIDSSQELLNAYNKMLPDMLIVIRLMGATEPEKAIASLEILMELCERNTSVIVNHMKIIVETCLEMANNTNLNEELRAKAISIIGWLTKVKKKAIIENKLVEPIIDTTFRMLSIKPVDDNDESYFGDGDEEEPVACASETLDALACNLPPEMIIAPLLCFVEPALASNDPYKKKAAYLSMAIVAEGCSDYVRTKHLKTCLRCICQGINEPLPVVKNAALFALGRFAEYLQPDVSTYSSELLPVLFDQLQRICDQAKTDQHKQSTSSNHMFYALEEFCENLELDLLPYLPTLMERLFNILMYPNVSAQLREHSLSTLGAAANACKEHIAPYFEQIIQILYPYLFSEKTQDPDEMALKIQAVETLGILARTVGKEQFASIAAKVLEFALNILKETTDPDLKKVTYGLCASMSTIMQGDIAPALPTIVGSMLASIQSTEGIVVQSKNDCVSGYPITEYSDEEDEDIENTDNEDESDDDSQIRYTVENSYTSEKEEAIIALKDIAEHTGEHFNSYLKNCFDKIMELINDPLEDIRESVIMTLTQFVINFWNVKTEEGVQATQEALRILMSQFATIIRLDENKKVVIAAVNSLVTLLKTIKESLLIGTGHKENIMACIKQIFTGDTACQDTEDDTENNEATESEQEEVLIECAGDLLSSFGKVASKEDFTPCFEANLPILINYFNKNDNEGLQSFAVGIIAECFQGLKENIMQFQHLYQFLMKCCKHSNEEVRNNAYYGVGEMVLHGKEAMYPCYMDILTTFSNAISQETHPGARDNILGAIARMILTNHSILPIDKIYPTFVQQLPLKHDFVEYKSIFESVLLLYSQGHEALKIQLKPLLKIAISALNEQKLQEQECKAVIFEFLQRVHRDFIDIWNETLTEVPVEYHPALAQLVA